MFFKGVGFMEEEIKDEILILLNQVNSKKSLLGILALIEYEIRKQAD